MNIIFKRPLILSILLTFIMSSYSHISVDIQNLATDIHAMKLVLSTANNEIEVPFNDVIPSGYTKNVMNIDTDLIAEESILSAKIVIDSDQLAPEIGAFVLVGYIRPTTIDIPMPVVSLMHDYMVKPLKVKDVKISDRASPPEDHVIMQTNSFSKMIITIFRTYNDDLYRIEIKLASTAL